MSGGIIYGSDGGDYVPPGDANIAPNGGAAINGTARYAGAYGSTAITTTNNTLPPLSGFGKVSVVYYWLDHGELTTSGPINISSGGSVSITAKGGVTGYDNHTWYLDGIKTSVSGGTFSFSGTLAGNYEVGLLVEKDSRIYNTNIIIKVE
jgi:hypothetical protein